MTPDVLTAAAGILLSLAFSYIPKLRNWYEPLDNTSKCLVMLAALIVVSLGTYGLSCAGMSSEFGLPSTCDKEGIAGLLRALILAMVANQGAYKLTPKPAAKG